MCGMEMAWVGRLTCGRKVMSMSRSRVSIACAMVGLALCGFGRQAAAQTSTFNLNMTAGTGLNATVGGWTVAFAPLSLSSCIFKVENPGTFTNTTQSNCSGVEMVETVYHNRLYLTFQGPGGTALESAVGSSATACGGGLCGNNFSNLTLGFTVTAPTGITVSSASLALTGSATLAGGGADLLAADLSKISGGEASPSGAFSAFSTNLSANPNKVTAAFASAVNSFSVSKDLKVIGYGATPGSTLVLSSFSQIYSPAAPEPISLSVLGVGLAGLVAARRARRRH
jgi:hypothetical protein